MPCCCGLGVLLQVRLLRLLLCNMHTCVATPAVGPMLI